MRRIIFRLIVFIIFTVTGVYIVNNNLHNNNIILTQENECDIVNTSKKEILLIESTIPETKLIEEVEEKTKEKTEEEIEQKTEKEIEQKTEKEITKENDEEDKTYEIMETPKEESIPEYNIPLDEDIQKYLYDKCKEYNVPYDLTLGVIKVESNFNPSLIHKNSNGSRDYGLFQINTINHKWLSEELGITDFLNPYQNIDAGVYMLSQLIQKYDNEHIVLMSYNMGERATKNLTSRGIDSSRYSRKVIAIKEELKNINIK